jgi:hypothetical protein
MVKKMTQNGAKIVQKSIRKRDILEVRCRAYFDSVFSTFFVRFSLRARKLRTLKIKLPFERELDFEKIATCASEANVDQKRHRKYEKNRTTNVKKSSETLQKTFPKQYQPKHTILNLIFERK